ncbi:MAG TPA: DMT family transporter [Blastocatellia bacterium]|nr:DMT family transporter [Blastocatellia bacterium]
MHNDEPSPALVYLAMAVAVVSIAFSSVFITKLERAGVTPQIVALYRMLLATALLLPAAIRYKWREITGLRRADAGLLCLAGLFLAIHFETWVASLQYIPIASSVMLVNCHPLLVVIASHFILHESPTRRGIWGTLVGLAGTALICIDGFRGLGTAMRGDICAILGALSMVGYFLIGRRTRARISLLGYATPVYGSCTVFLLIWAVATGSRLASYGKTDWFYFAALAIVPTIMGHTVLNWAIKHVRASAISIALLGEPVAASVLAFGFFSQIPTGATILGGALVLGGIYLATSNTPLATIGPD